MSAVQTVDSPDAKATLLAFLAQVDEAARDRGRDFQFAHRVLKITRRDDETITANVRTELRLFATELRRVGPLWTSICTCGRGGPGGCEHAAGLALVWLERIRHAHDPFSRLSLDSLRQSRQFEPESTWLERKPAKVSFRQQWEGTLAQKLGRPLAPEEGAFLGRLSQIFHNSRGSSWFSGDEVRQLGFTAIDPRRFGARRAYEGWWDEPPADPMALWQYLAYDIESAGLRIPEFMAPVTDTGPIRAQLANRARHESVLRWKERFRQFAESAQRRPVRPDAALALEPLEVRLRLGASDWTIETRPGVDSPWKNAPRALMERLMRDERGALAWVEASSATYAFLSLCQEHFRLQPSAPIATGKRETGQLLHRLLSHPLARGLVVNAAGQPLAFSTAPVAWRLARSAQNENDYELALHLPDGKPLPPGTTHLPGQPDYYIHESLVYRGPPALDGVSATASIVPAEAVEQPDVLRMLRQFGTQLPPEIEARFVTVPMRARIECALELEDFGDEILTLQLFAISDQPPVRRVWSILGWNAPPRERPDADRAGKIHSFDLTAPEHVASRLVELKVGYNDFQRRWTRRLTRSFPEEFLQWRESLPPGVEVLASGELASLLGAPVRASVNFELSETTVHRDWFDLALALKPEDTTLTTEEIALLLKARGKLVRLPGKGWRRLTVEIEGAPAAALEAAGFDPSSAAEAALSGEKHRFHALQLAHGAVAALLPERQAEGLRTQVRAITAPAPPEVPAGLRAELRGYQREGFQFLAFLSANHLGGVLADDMGLGKTLQALAWLLWLAEQQPAEAPLRALVVCPKSVVGNWEAETARFAPALGVVRFRPGLAGAAANHVGDPGRPTIVVANYAQLRLAESHFQAQTWHAVVLDEGQFIKNPSSKVAQVARELPGDHRLVLTGTPIENRLLDLWSLFAFALPGLLGTQAAFKRHYAQDNPLALVRLRSRVRHFLLRRTKGQVAADLPARTEEDVTVDLEGVQAQLYQAELKRARAELLRLETTRQPDQARFNVLASLMRLRQICCHPALIDVAHREAPAAKLDELMERLEELRAEGHQVLVFSQFVGMLELIRERLVVAGINHLLLTGQTENRDALVAQFQADRSCTVFLLSLKAAGFGLNLTAASYVFLYDPWWNPAVEAQAIDRTHRIGQAVPVNAYRLIARGTVEEKIRALQREKAALAGAIIQEESLASLLDLDSLRQILG